MLGGGVGAMLPWGWEQCLAHSLHLPQTFLNPWYEASLVPIYIITVSMGIWAFFTAGGSLRTILLCLPCKDPPASSQAGDVPGSLGGRWKPSLQGA